MNQWPASRCHLAQVRSSNISQLRYELVLSIPDTLAEPVTGTNVLRFRLADPTKPLVIDFDAEGAPHAAVTANGVGCAHRFS